MEHYLKVWYLKNAHWCAYRAVKKGYNSARIWVPPRDVTWDLDALLGEEERCRRSREIRRGANEVADRSGDTGARTIGSNVCSGLKEVPWHETSSKDKNVEVSTETAKVVKSICVQLVIV